MSARSEKPVDFVRISLSRNSYLEKGLSISPPVVMTLAGNDPTGGAGIAADIETLVSLGCHPAPVITALTVQDTHNVHALFPADPDQVLAQARAVLADMSVAAIKIGVIGSADNAVALRAFLNTCPHIPVILDPVLAAGGGTELADAELIEAIQTRLLPMTTILTPNSIEARRLAPEADTLEACAMALLARGCRYVLITGGHEAESSTEVRNRLYSNNRLLETYSWPRLPEQYHGSGCTLAAAVAGLLAQGHQESTSEEAILSIVYRAQDYAWRSLQAGYRAGGGQWLPHRLYWTAADEVNRERTALPGPVRYH